MIDPIEWGKSFAKSMKQHVSDLLAPIEARIKALETSEPLKPSHEYIQAAVNKFLAENPPSPGKDAEPVSDNQLAQVVASYMALNPPAPGRDGRDGLAGINGEKGANGKDGNPGKDGLDGLGFDDIQADHDGEGKITIKFVQGERVKSFDFNLPSFIDKGVYRPENQYKSGNGVTYGGSFWIAQKDNPQGKPDDGNGDWRLSVKKGRDGRDGKPGEQGPKGERGFPGSNGTNLQ